MPTIEPAEAWGIVSNRNPERPRVIARAYPCEMDCRRIQFSGEKVIPVMIVPRDDYQRLLERAGEI